MGCVRFLAGGLALASLGWTLWQLYLFIGLGVGCAAASLGNAPHSALLARWFEGAALSRAMSVVYAGLGVGSLLLVPLAQVLIDTGGWRVAYGSMAGIVVLLRRSEEHPAELQPLIRNRSAGLRL